MVKRLLLIMCFPVMLQAQEVQNIGQLFIALKTHPQTRGDEIATITTN